MRNFSLFCVCVCVDSCLFCNLSLIVRCSFVWGSPDILISPCVCCCVLSHSFVFVLRTPKKKKFPAKKKGGYYFSTPCLFFSPPLS